MYTHCDICKNELEKVKLFKYNGKINVCQKCQKAKQKAIREAKKLNKNEISTNKTKKRGS